MMGKKTKKVQKKLTGYATIDKPWKKFQKKTNSYKQEKIERMYEKTIYNMLEEKSANKLDMIAFNYFQTNITYKELLEIIKHQAQSLHKMGLKKNDTILTILPNLPESWELIYSSNKLGIKIVPLLPTIAPVQVETIIEKLQIKTIFIYKAFYEKYKKQINNKSIENVIILEGTETIKKTSITGMIVNMKSCLNKKNDQKHIYTNSKIKSYKEFINMGIGTIAPTNSYEKNETAAYIATSGTTGIPKLVELTNEAFNALALEHQLELNVAKGDKSLNIMPPSIAYGFSVVHYSLVIGFNSTIIPDLVTTTKYLKKLWKKYKPDQFIGGPIHARLIAELVEKDKKVAKLAKNTKNICSGGATLKKSIETYLYEKKYNIAQGYGCTETCGGATYNDPKVGKEYSVGIPLCLTDIAIFKKDTEEELKYGQEGELCITGPTLMKCYFDNKEETDKVLKKHKDGKIWMHIADEAYMDEDGHVFFKGRFKDIFMRTGFNIHPEKINEKIEAIEEVKESYVMGVEHPDEECVPVAFISLEEGANIDKLKEKLTELKAVLDELAIPYEYVFLDTELPRNAGGKVMGKELLKQSGINYFKHKKPKNQFIKQKTE